MSNIIPGHDEEAHNPARSYADEAGDLDDQIDAALLIIRRQQDAGEITVHEAADLRVAALEQHIGAIRALRLRHFPEGTPS